MAGAYAKAFTIDNICPVMPRLKNKIKYSNPAMMHGRSVPQGSVTMASEDSSKVVLSIDGYISWWSNNKEDLKWQLYGHNPDTIEMRVNSLGGSLIEALDMYNYLVQYCADNDVKEVTVDLVGNCASAATLFPLLASPGKARAASNIQILYHPPSLGANGTVDDLEKAKQQLQDFEDIAIEMYMTRSGKSKAKILAFLKEDRFHRSKKVVEMGLIDEVYEVTTATTMVTQAQVEMFGLPTSKNSKFLMRNKPSKKKKTPQKSYNAFMGFMKTVFGLDPVETNDDDDDDDDGGDGTRSASAGAETAARVVKIPAGSAAAGISMSADKTVTATLSDGTEVEVPIEMANSVRANRAEGLTAINENVTSLMTQIAEMQKRMDQAGDQPPAGVSMSSIPEGVSPQQYVDQTHNLGGDFGFRATGDSADQPGRPASGFKQDTQGRFGYAQVSRAKTGDESYPELNEIERLFMRNEQFLKNRRDFSMCDGVNCDSIDVSTLNQELGACSTLISTDIFYKGMKDFGLLECFTLVENVKDQISFIEMLMGSVTQNWTCDFNPKSNRFSWCTTTGEVCPGKVDLCMCLQSLTKTYFGRLLSPGFTPWNYTFSSFIYEMLIKQVYKDLLCAIAQGKKDDTVAGTPAACELTWMDGVQTLVQELVDDGFPVVPTGDIYVPGMQCQIVEDLQCSLSDDYQNEPMCLLAPPAFLKALKKDIKNKGGEYCCIEQWVKDSVFSGIELTEGNIRVVAYPKWGNSQRLVLTAKWNLQILVDMWSDFSKVRIQQHYRKEAIMLDFQAGFNIPVRSPELLAISAAA